MILIGLQKIEETNFSRTKQAERTCSIETKMSNTRKRGKKKRKKRRRRREGR